MFFLWSILAYSYPVDNKTLSYSLHFIKFNLEGLENPMEVEDIAKFEHLKTGLRIKVFELNGTVITPIHINKNYFQPQTVLLLYQNPYCLITKLHCLINKDLHIKQVCRRCLTASSSQPVLIDRMERCINQQPTTITFSWKDHLKFEDHYMKVNVPIIVYADFECINQTQNTTNLASLDPKVLYKQIPIAVGFYLITPSGNIFCSYFDEGCTGGQQSCVEVFVDEMLTLQREANKYFKTNKPLEMSPEEEEQFEQSTICWLCEEPFTEGKVRHHDHLIGKYRRAAHNICNINCKQKSSSFVPIFFHSFSGYDCHLIFQQLILSACNQK